MGDDFVSAFERVKYSICRFAAKETTMKFAERLKEQRIKHGYNQQYVANYMRVSQVSISNWERGLKEPSYQALVDLSQLFGKSTDYMLGYDEKNEEK